MSSRAAEFASAILIGVLVGVFAGAYLITMPYGAADDCLTEPKGVTQQGQHWFYRIERGTKRHCWYLKDEGGQVTQAAAAEPSAPAKATSQNTTSRNTDSVPAQHSIADAHAELRLRARIEDDAGATQPARVAVAPNAATNPAGANDNWANNVPRWPAPTGVSSSPAQPTESQTLVVADNTQPNPALAQPATAPTMAAPTMTAPMVTAPITNAPTTTAPMTTPMSAAADNEATPAASGTPAEKYSGSLQELLVVAFAALALAGLTGSAVYRLGRLRLARRHDASRRSADWQPPQKKSRKARVADPRPIATRADDVDLAPNFNDAPRPDLAPQPRFAPQPEYAAQPEHASRPATRPNYEPQHNVAVLSQYAPKPRPGIRMTRELEETFESIEELLIRLAK